MPYQIKKVSNAKCYKVINKDTKKIYSKCTSLENAKKQIRLLHMVKNIMKSSPKV